MNRHQADVTGGSLCRAYDIASNELQSIELLAIALRVQSV